MSGDLSSMGDEELVNEYESVQKDIFVFDSGGHYESWVNAVEEIKPIRAEILRRLSLVREYGRYKCQPMESPSGDAWNFRNARGATGWKPGDKPSEEAIRLLRDAKSTSHCWSPQDEACLRVKEGAD